MRWILDVNSRVYHLAFKVYGQHIWAMHQDLETMVASFVTQDQCIKIWKQWWLLLWPKINASRFGNNGGFFCAPRSMHQDLETMVASFVPQDQCIKIWKQWWLLLWPKIFFLMLSLWWKINAHVRFGSSLYFACFLRF